MSIAAFYNQSRWGTRFGVVDDDHPNGHRGLDIESHPGEGIPALRPGTVVRSQYSSILGWVVVVQAGPGDFDGYCHTINGAGKGANVTAGQIVAAVADYDDLHGSAWTGPHTHITRGPSADSVFSGTVWDPLPVVIAALASTAGDASTPFPLPNPVVPLEDIMSNTKLIYFQDSSGSQQLAIIGSDPTDPIYGRVFIDWLHTSNHGSTPNPLGNGLTSEDVVFFYGPSKRVPDINVWNRLKGVPKAIRTMADLHAALAK